MRDDDDTDTDTDEADSAVITSRATVADDDE